MCGAPAGAQRRRAKQKRLAWGEALRVWAAVALGQVRSRSQPRDVCGLQALVGLFDLELDLFTLG
jgi:hypothetical protein